MANPGGREVDSAAVSSQFDCLFQHCIAINFKFDPAARVLIAGVCFTGRFFFFCHDKVPSQVGDLKKIKVYNVTVFKLIVQ